MEQNIPNPIEPSVAINNSVEGSVQGVDTNLTSLNNITEYANLTKKIHDENEAATPAQESPSMAVPSENMKASGRIQAILDNPELDEAQKVHAINEMGREDAAKMNEAIKARDPAAAYKQIMSMAQAMGISVQDLVGGKNPFKPKKVKDHHPALENAAERKRQRKREKNLAALAKGALKAG